MNRLIVICMLVSLAGSGSVVAEPTDESMALAAAMQSGYFDELDLDLYESLADSYGDKSRVIRSDNIVRVGGLAVTAKLVVPESTAPAKTGFMASADPLPVRIMLDYALVSCRNGCLVGMVSDASGAPKTYKARHETSDLKTFSRRPVGIGPREASERFASMVVVEGKAATMAIEQINASRRLDVFVTAAVHGSMRFTFTTAER